MNIAPPNQASQDEATSLAMAALGTEKFESLRSDGRLLSEAQAVLLALPQDSNA
jgi:hypothetical protein